MMQVSDISLGEILNQDQGKDIAADLLKIKAVFLRPDEPFTWASGIKSPIYCDNRLVISYPELRDKIANAFAETIKTKFPNVEVIAGTATAGIPHAAWVADKLGLPMVYIRSGSKAHGRENQIEGLLEAKQKVVVVEDLISTGGSSLKAVDAVKETGADVLGVVAIFSYQLQKAIKAFAEAETHYYTLTNYPILLEVALAQGLIADKDMQALEKWRLEPESFA